MKKSFRKRSRIIAAMEALGAQCGPREIRDKIVEMGHVGCATNTVMVELRRLRESGRVTRVRPGVYDLTDKEGGALDGPRGPRRARPRKKPTAPKVAEVEGLI